MSQNILKASHIELQGYRRCGRKRDGDVSLIIFKLPIWANTLRERAAKESIETATASNGVSRTYAMVSSHYSRRQLLANAPIAASRASWCAFQSGDHFRTHARMTLTGLSCCSGRKVALLSASKMKAECRHCIEGHLLGFTYSAQILVGVRSFTQQPVSLLLRK